MKNERVKQGSDPKRTRSIPRPSPAPIRAFNSQITSNTSNKLRRAIQTKSTSEKGAVMCDFRWGANPGWGLSFAVGCCGAPFGAVTLKSAQSAALSVYSHLYRVFPVVVNTGNSLVVLLDAINCHTHFIITGLRLHNGNVVDRLAIAVVHLERLPVRREARSKTQFIHFKP